MRARFLAEPNNGRQVRLATVHPGAAPGNFREEALAKSTSAWQDTMTAIPSGAVLLLGRVVMVLPHSLHGPNVGAVSRCSGGAPTVLWWSGSTNTGDEGYLSTLSWFVVVWSDRS